MSGINETYHSLQDIANAARSIADKSIEACLLICVSDDNIITSITDVTLYSSEDNATIDTRLIYETLKPNNGQRFFLVHNHPNAFCMTPSEEDLYATSMICSDAFVFGFVFLDHLIINSNLEYFSLKENNLMDVPWSKQKQVAKDLLEKSILDKFRGRNEVIEFLKHV